MLPAPILALAAVAAPVVLHRGLPPHVLLALAGAWFVSPVVAWFISRSRPARGIPLRPAQIAFLRRTARHTWAYFDVHIGPASRWLPPDNAQEQPAAVADRTSPTNIGMALASTLAACDLAT